MNVLGTIHSLQQKPERARKRMLVFLVTLIMAIILVVWVFNLQRILSLEQSEEPLNNAAVVTPFASIGEAFRSLYGK